MLLCSNELFVVVAALGGIEWKAFALAFTVVSVLFAVLLSLSMGTLNARDADLASLTFAAA
jgi:hypothetical protein